MERKNVAQSKNQQIDVISEAAFVRKSRDAMDAYKLTEIQAQSLRD